jgi:hypothetical protein
MRQHQFFLICSIVFSSKNSSALMCDVMAAIFLLVGIISFFHSGKGKE